MTLAAVNAAKGGKKYNDWTEIYAVGLLVKALKSKINSGDLTSAQTIAIYDNLELYVAGRFMGAVTLNPQAQSPNSYSIVVNTSVYATQFNTQNEVFFGVTQFQMANWQANFYPLFGNAPLFELWTQQPDGTYAQDTGTTPIVAYVGGNPNNGMLSATWNFAVATTGFVKVVGINPTSQSLPSSGLIPYTNTTTTKLTNAQLNATYPNARYGQEVYCPNIVGAPAKYVKSDNTVGGPWQLEPYTLNT